MAVWSEAFGRPISWRGPTPNKYTDGMTEYRGVVLHIAEGFYEGTISWQLGASHQVSSHWIVGRNGQIAQMVDTKDASWTQSNGNRSWLSIEFEGFTSGNPLHAKYPWETLTDAQLDAAAALFAKAHLERGFPRQLADGTSGRGLGYHAMGGASWGGHYDCPGPPIIAQRAEILRRAELLINPPPPPQEDDMPFGYEVRLPVKVGDIVEVTIPPVNAGGFGWGKAWMKIVSDTSRLGPVSYRIALGNGSAGGFVPAASQLNASGQAEWGRINLTAQNPKWESGTIPDGTCVLSVDRVTSGNDAADVEDRHVTLCVEYDKRV